MKFGVAIPHFSRLASRDAVIRTVGEAESLGYDAVWTTDHVLMAADQAEPYGTILEAVTTLAYIAAITERVRLGISVLVLTQREPVLAAKQIATLDVLSGGRLSLGVGAGWNEREFGFLGASFPERGKRLDEYLRVLRTLWSEPTPQFNGAYVRFADVSFAPRPVQPGGPPIWLGGASPAALRRAAKLCDGWQPVGMDVDRFGAGMARIRALADGRHVAGGVRLRAAVGRALPTQRTAAGVVQAQLSGSRQEVIEQIAAYAAAGASELVLYFGSEDLETTLTDMRAFAGAIFGAV